VNGRASEADVGAIECRETAKSESSDEDAENKMLDCYRCKVDV